MGPRRAVAVLEPSGTGAFNTPSPLSLGFRALRKVSYLKGRLRFLVDWADTRENGQKRCARHRATHSARIAQAGAWRGRPAPPRPRTAWLEPGGSSAFLNRSAATKPQSEVGCYRPAAHTHSHTQPRRHEPRSGRRSERAARRRALLRRDVDADRPGPAHAALAERGQHRPHAAQPQAARGAHGGGAERQLVRQDLHAGAQGGAPPLRGRRLDKRTLRARVAQVSRRLIALRERKNMAKLGLRLPRQVVAAAKQGRVQ